MRWSSRGKSVVDLATEREANLAYLKHLDPERDAATIKRLRQQNTHIGNRIQKLNERKPE